MQSYKLIVSYDGTNYCGWQWQPQGNAIMNVMRDTFLRTFKQEELLMVGASRTDSGVHSEGQTVRIRTKISNICIDKMMNVWNNSLPDDIVIQSLEKIDDQFHPQHDIAEKIYEYTFFLKRPNPDVQRFGWFYRFPIDPQKLVRCLSLFVGEHNFKAFCKEDDDKDTIRTIESIALENCKKTGGYKIKIVGKSFLRYMIRRIVGAVLAAAGKESITEQDLKRMLITKNNDKTIPTAPSKGLYLKKISYYPKGERE